MGRAGCTSGAGDASGGFDRRTPHRDGASASDAWLTPFHPAWCATSLRGKTGKSYCSTAVKVADRWPVKIAGSYWHTLPGCDTGDRSKTYTVRRYIAACPEREGR